MMHAMLGPAMTWIKAFAHAWQRLE
jgi:hypothetical protein